MAQDLVVMTTHDLARVMGVPSVSEADWQRLATVTREIRLALLAEGLGLCTVFSPNDMHKNSDQPKYSRALMDFADRSELRERLNGEIQVTVLKSRNRDPEAEPKLIFDYDFSRFTFQ